MEERHSLTTPSPSKPTPTPSPPTSCILHRVLLFLAFLFLLPLLPSEAPEFLHYTPLTTSWELIHLLLVGIAISYGLCSRRTTTTTDPDHHQKDIPHKSHPSNLQVASVFDDEDGGCYDHYEGLVSPNEGANKTHMWNSRYRRRQPTVVLDDKPLCLPIRSLRSQVPEAEKDKATDGFDDGGVVLPSPIPWRTRSGRLEAKVEPSPTYASPAPPSPVLDKAPSFRSRRPSPSPSSSRSHSPDQNGRRSNEDGGTPMRLRRHLNSSSSSPVPPPPPPPPPRPFSASRRSLYPSERFPRRQQPSKEALAESTNWSGGREQQRSFPPPPAPVPEIKQLRRAKEKVKRGNGSSRKFILDSDDDRGSGSEGELSEEEESLSDASSSVTEAEAEGNEVDKKADEFIAKFREQIRQQRIESIKRSAAQRKRSPK